MADVEDPARVGSQIVRDRGLDVGPGNDLRIDGLLHQSIVEEARRAIAGAVHRDQPRHARRRVERLSKPGRVAGDFLGCQG